MKTVLAVLLFATCWYVSLRTSRMRLVGPSVAAPVGPSLTCRSIKKQSCLDQSASIRRVEVALGNTTTRVGLDGIWVGANHGKSYFFVLVNPGDHHLCVAQQTMLKTSSKRVQRSSRLRSGEKVSLLAVARRAVRNPTPGSGAQTGDDRQRRRTYLSSRTASVEHFWRPGSNRLVTESAGRALASICIPGDSDSSPSPATLRKYFPTPCPAM